MPTTTEVIKEKEEKKTTPKTVPEDNLKPPTRRLVDIGRGQFARFQVDPYSRLTNYIWSRMHVIDILPCDFEIPLVRSPEVATESLIKALTPTISYNARMLDYEEQCAKHGLDRRSGVRLWITNETQADEHIDVSYEDSIFQRSLDSFSQFLRPIRQIGRSASSRYGQNVLGLNKYIGPLIEKGEEYLGKGIVGGYGLLNPNAEDDPNFKNNVNKILDNVGELTKVLANVVLKGNRITMPKIWQNSSYGQNFSCFVKLSSPYGTPQAITKYIVRPLLYLLILAAPRTDDDVSFGNSHPITIRAYGLGWYKLGAIKALSIRRGGSDGMYNVHRQPLTVDVTISFQNLIDGFAVFGKEHDEADLLARSSTSLGTNIAGDTTSQALMTTVESFVDSFRPIDADMSGGLSSWLTYKQNMGKFTKGQIMRYPEAYSTGLTVEDANNLNQPSIIDQAISKIKEIDPTAIFPENATADDIYNFIESAAGSTVGLYNDIKTKLFGLRTGTVASQEQSVRDYVRATATDNANDLSDTEASDADDDLISSLIDRLPDLVDFNPQRLT